MHKFKETIKILGLVIGIYFLNFSMDLCYNLYNYSYFGILTGVKEQILSIFIITCLFFIFWAITKKTGIAYIIISVILILVTVLNQIKIIYTDEPVAFSDILFLRNSSELVGIISGTFIQSIKRYIPITIVYINILAMFCIILNLTSYKIENSKGRIIMVLVPILILVVLFFPNKFITNVISKNIFEFNNRMDYSRLTSKKYELAYNGVISGIYGQLLENRIFEPDGYSEEFVYNEIKKVQAEKEDKSFGTPNIIVVFAESFWDVTQLEEIKFNTDVTSNFKNLKENGIFFNMITPSYGGVSANVEYEFLTGANMEYFPTGYIPPMRLYNNKKYKDTPSIIHELNNNGYRTKIVNYTSSKSFDIGKFYEYIGMQETEFITAISKKKIKGQYVSDEYVIDNIIKEFENKPKNEKLFYMTLTMQSHMPYTKDKYDEYDINITESKLSDEINDILMSYAQGIYDMDVQLKRLYEYIQSIDEPTLIIFYGDHLPYLKTTNGENAIEYLNYFNTEDEKINYYRKYNTQSLILANFKVEENNQKFIGPDLLGCYVINRMDINISEYYKWLNKYNDILPTSNWYTAIDSKGNLYYTNELENDLLDAYKTRERVQYKYSVNK